MFGACKRYIGLLCLLGMLQNSYANDSLDREARVYSSMAKAYYAKGNYQLALRHSLMALDLRRTQGEPFHISQSLSELGDIYYLKQDYTNSIKFYRESLAFKQVLRDSSGAISTLLSIAKCFYTDKKFDSAYHYAARAEQQATELQQQDTKYMAIAFMGKAQLAFKQFDIASRLLQEAENGALQLKDQRSLANIYDGLGDIYLEQKQYNKAIVFFKKGLEIARQLNDLEQLAVYYRKLMRVHRRMNSLAAAFLYMDSARNLSHNLLSEETIRQMNEMATIYETAEKEKKIEKLNAQHALAQAEARQRKRERNYFILSSILLMATAIGGYFALKLLNRQKGLIEQSLQEKEILLKEIHHRVKNNLQMVSSLLSLQSDYITDAQALDAVKESRNRVHSMALIHQNLYEEEHLTSVPMQEYISKLCDNLLYSYNIHPGRIRLVKEIDPLLLDVEIVVPLGLILNELITNCIKYAFRERTSGVIRIIVKSDQEQLYVCVHDDGVGLPPGFSPGHSSSFGYKMIRAFTQKAKGAMTVSTTNGTRVELVLRNKKHHSLCTA